MSATPTFPGVYIGEIVSGISVITPVATSITAFIGRAPMGAVDEPTDCFSFSDYESLFGGLTLDYPLSYAVEDFFLNGGVQAIIVRVVPGASTAPATSDFILGSQEERTGLYALDKADLFNLLCIPWDVRGSDISPTIHAAAATYCVGRRAMYILDGPGAWADSARKGAFENILPGDLGIGDEPSQRNSAVYFPMQRKSDVLRNGMIDVFPVCGVVAGQIALTDLTRGVWKAPAGASTAIAGIAELDYNLTDSQQGMLNSLGVNCLRTIPVLGAVIWGARTLRGADLTDDDYKYIPVRRLTLFIEESLYRGTKFAVVEPNDEALWSRMRATIDAFMAGLAREGAFYSYAVTCDATTNSEADIERGVCNVLVQFAPLRPAEFIVLQIQQLAAVPAS